MIPGEMRAAVELHEPIMYDRHGQVTTDPAKMSTKYGRRCGECGMPVQAAGCRTWRVANGGKP